MTTIFETTILPLATGTWTVHDGFVQSSGDNAFLAYAEKLPAPVRIEYDTRVVGSQGGDLSGGRLVGVWAVPRPHHDLHLDPRPPKPFHEGLLGQYTDKDPQGSGARVGRLHSPGPPGQEQEKSQQKTHG